MNMKARISLRPPFFITGSGGRKRVSPQAVNLLYGLMARRLLTAEMIMELLWSNTNQRPDFWRNAIRSYVHELNVALQPCGWRTTNRRCFGWTLEHTT